MRQQTVTLPRNQPREWGVRRVIRELTGTAAPVSSVTVRLERGDGVEIGTYTAAEDRAFGGWVAQIPALALDPDVAALVAVETVVSAGVAHVERVRVTVVDG